MTILNKVSPKELIHYIGYLSGVGLPLGMYSFFATEKDIDRSEAFLICKYISDNWEKIYQEAKLHWEKNVAPKLKQN